ncbi:conserved Plasmodium protein, unknown function, partial [Plasmodium ovale curtisi]
LDEKRSKTKSLIPCKLPNYHISAIVEGKNWVEKLAVKEIYSAAIVRARLVDIPRQIVVLGCQGTAKITQPILFSPTMKGKRSKRLGKDSMRKFEQCWICLRNAESPVSTPYGHIFCKICIINNFLTQKKKYTQKKKEYEDYIKDINRKKKEESSSQKEMERRKFVQDLENISGENIKVEEKSIVDISNNFWLARNSNVVKDGIQKKHKPPTNKLICPVSGKPLKMHDLITVNPETLSKNHSESEKWVCSFSKKNIDHHRAVLIKKTGQIILKSIFDKYIYGKTNSLEIEVSEGDFIDLQPGGTVPPVTPRHFFSMQHTLEHILPFSLLLPQQRGEDSVQGSTPLMKGNGCN